MTRFKKTLFGLAATALLAIPFVASSSISGTTTASAATTAYCETCWDYASVYGSKIGTCNHPNFPSCNAAVYRYRCNSNPTGHFGTVLCDAGHYN